MCNRFLMHVLHRETKTVPSLQRETKSGPVRHRLSRHQKVQQFTILSFGIGITAHADVR